MASTYFYLYVTLSTRQMLNIEHGRAMCVGCIPEADTCKYLTWQQLASDAWQVKDYPGLVRVIAWVLNGLELVVQKARCNFITASTLLHIFSVA